MTRPTPTDLAGVPSAPGVGFLKAVALDVPDMAVEASFWAALTGGAVVSEEDDWVVVRTPDRWDIAFQLAPDHIAPQWPGQRYPQQAHLDLIVPDLAAAGSRATELGAGVLRENDRWFTLRDPAGHPFDLCLDEGSGGVRVRGVTFDCTDASALVRFWSGVLGVPVAHDADGVAMLDGPRPVHFQSVEGYQPPRWPDPEHPQQVHLDIHVAEPVVGQEAVLELGATRLPGGGDDFWVFADPAGHPFCLTF